MKRHKPSLLFHFFDYFRRGKEAAIERSSNLLFKHQHRGFCGRESGGDGEEGQKRERPQKFCQEQDAWESESDLSRYCHLIGFWSVLDKACAAKVLDKIMFRLKFRNIS